MLSSGNCKGLVFPTVLLLTGMVQLQVLEPDILYLNSDSTTDMHTNCVTLEIPLEKTSQHTTIIGRIK